MGVITTLQAEGDAFFHDIDHVVLLESQNLPAPLHSAHPENDADSEGALLQIKRDPLHGDTPVPIGAGITVGRGREVSLCLEQCADLSRRHFSVRPESGMWLLEDLGSRNGTMVDGVAGRITRRLLRDGDIIFAGELMFLFVNSAD